MESLLITMSVPDIRKKRIPIGMLIASIILSFTVLILSLIGNTEYIGKLIMTLVGLLPGIGIIILGKVTGKVGLADGIIISVIGALEGYMGAIAILSISCFIMSIPAIILLTIKKVKKETALAFVPFISVGYLLWIFVFG